jgi:hypothetical protein
MAGQSGITLADCADAAGELATEKGNLDETDQELRL